MILLINDVRDRTSTADLSPIPKVIPVRDSHIQKEGVMVPDICDLVLYVLQIAGVLH